MKCPRPTCQVAPIFDGYVQHTRKTALNKENGVGFYKELIDPFT